MHRFESRAPHRWGRRAALVASTVGLVGAAAPAKAVGPGVEHASSAPSSGSNDPPEAPLRITVGSTIKNADLLRAWIVERSLDAAKARIPVVEGQEQWVAVAIDGAPYDYRVSAVAMRNGEPLGPAGEPVACVCNSDELLELVDARIAAVAEELRVAPAGAAVVPGPAPIELEPMEGMGPETPHHQTSTDSEPNEPRGRRMGPLGYSGVAVGVLGAGALGAGIALVLRPDQMRGTQGEAWAFTTEPLGITMTVGGSLALATGVASIAVDLARRRGRPISLAPTFGRRQVGLALTRRF